MEYVYPDYYKEFACIAGKCEDTCCAGWQVMIDEESLKKYKQEKGSFGNRLRNCIRWQESCFDQYDGRCAFLNEENLCDIYAELGKDRLCRTCSTYPRHIEEFENLREVSLSLSCPQACRLILGQQSELRLLYEEREGEEEIEDFDFFFFTKLEEIREYLLRLMHRKDVGIHDRLSIALALAYDVQRRIQKDRMYDIDALLERYQAERAVGDLQKKIADYRITYEGFIEFVHRLADVYEELEPLNEDWFDQIDQMCDVFAQLGEKEYAEAYLQFRRAYPDLEHDLEQISVTLIYTYVCGAVYDYDVLSKIKFVFVSCLLTELLDFACWLTQGHRFTRSDQVKIVYRCSREIEHSDQNLNQLEKELKTNSLFHMERLIRVLSMQKGDGFH